MFKVRIYQEDTVQTVPLAPDSGLSLGEDKKCGYVFPKGSCPGNSIRLSYRNGMWEAFCTGNVLHNGKLVQNAALQKRLDIKSKDAADLFEQLQRAERLGKGKDSAFRMVSDMIAAYPNEFDELLKKSRTKQSAPSFKANSRGNDRGGK